MHNLLQKTVRQLPVIRNIRNRVMQSARSLHPFFKPTHMRKLYTLSLALVCLYGSAQTKKNIESKIEKVTVFLEGAQVERQAKVMLPAAGKYELVFTNISPAVEEQSIQVKADGNLTVLSVIQQQNFLREQQKQDEIRELEQLKETQAEKLALQRNILNVYKQEETMLVKNQQIGGANNGLKAADLKEAADFQRARLTEVYQKQMETDRLIKKMETELGKTNRQLFELNQKADQSTSEIHVTVTAKEQASSHFTVTYLVKQAGWYPTYDIRVKDISSPISLQYKANVYQQSGEDWKDIKLFLSTGNPNENGTKPVISNWYLKYGFAIQPKSNIIQSDYSPNAITGVVIDEKGESLPGVSVRIKGTRTGVAADNKGQFRVLAKPGDILVVSGAGLESVETAVNNTHLLITAKRVMLTGTEVVVTSLGQASGGSWIASGYRGTGSGNYKKKKEETGLTTTTTYQPTTALYEIKEPYTILNDGKTYMAEIDGYEIKAQYEYYAAPRIEPDAYLTAKVVDWQELNLLPGDANLFFEGTFLGKSLLDVNNAGDTLNISLGKDKGVSIKRTLLKDYSSRRFIGSNKTDTRQYEIAIRNNKQQAVSIIVEDQFPISTQKEIEVQDRKYEGAKLDDDTQKLTWQMQVDPKKEQKVNFRYEVKYPKDKILKLD